MDITIDQATITKALARAVGATDPKGTMPIPSHVLLKADGDGLTITATDLFKALTMRVACTVKTPGSMAIPAKDLLERVKAMPRAPITLAQKDSTLTLKAAGSSRKFTVRGLPGEDFPPVAKLPDDIGESIPVIRLKALMDGSAHAVSTDQTRAHLNSMLFEFDGDIARTAGTDGHRLALSTGAIKTREPFKMLIPESALKEVRKLCDEALAEGSGDATMNICIDHQLALWRFASFTFSCKTVEAQFPPYSQVIPKEGNNATVNRSILIDIIRAVSVASNDRTGGIKLAFTTNKLEVFAEGPESGDGRDEMVIEYTGPKLSTGLAARYLIDALNSTVGESATLSLLGELDPIKVTPVGGDKFVGVVMPMRI